MRQCHENKCVDVFARSRGPFLTLGLLWLILLHNVADAAAQHVSDGASMPPSSHEEMEGESTMVHAALHLESGQTEAFGATRNYQGMTAMVAIRSGRFSAALHAPVYQIELGKARGRGLGDVHISGQWAVWSQAMTQIGFSGGFMPPIGDDRDGIGMGHSMIMSGGFIRSGHQQIRVMLKVIYAGSLGSRGHTEHGALVWPSVAPMNAHEIRSSATVDLILSPSWSAQLSGFAAVPLGTGAFIALVGGEFHYKIGRLSIGAGARHGLGIWC